MDAIHHPQLGGPKCLPDLAGLPALADLPDVAGESVPKWNAAHQTLPFTPNRNSNRYTPELETCPNS